MKYEIEIATDKAVDSIATIKESISSVVDRHYDLWMSRLVPLLRQKNKSVYKGIVSILRRAGYDHANVGNVGASFRRARKSREAKNDK